MENMNRPYSLAEKTESINEFKRLMNNYNRKYFLKYTEKDEQFDPKENQSNIRIIDHDE